MVYNPYIYLNEIFAAIVAEMVTCNNFDFGYWPDVSNRLLTKGLTQAGQQAKYPLIVLHSEFRQDREYNSIVMMSTNPSIYIIARTKVEYTNTDRVTKVYKEVLEPIYYELLNKLSISNYIDTTKPENLDHERNDLFNANVRASNKSLFPEQLDVIEIKFKSLKIFKNCRK